MAKVVKDLNLFKAASKTDKQIQTGVSKNFLMGIICIVMLVAVGAFAANLFVQVGELQAVVDDYNNRMTYAQTLNELGSKIQADTNIRNEITRSINSISKIGEYSNDHSDLYPGITTSQKMDILTSEYYVGEATITGCLPTDVESVEYLYTDGFTPITIYSADKSESQRIFNAGYMLISIEVNNPNVADTYISNIVSLAPDVFAVEEGASDPENITADSFERGYLMNKDGEVLKMYVLAKLKSSIEIVLEDAYFLSKVSDMSTVSYSPGTISIALELENMRLSQMALYLDSMGIWADSTSTGIQNYNKIGDIEYYSGTIELELAGVTTAQVE